MKTTYSILLLLLMTGILSSSMANISNTSCSAKQNPRIPSWKQTGLLPDSHTDSIIVRNDHDTIRLTFSFDPAGLLLTKTEHKYLGTLWVNQAQISYTYTSSGKLSISTETVWMNGNWENIQQCHYSYNTVNQNTSIIKKDWVNNSWVNAELSEMTYDTLSGRLTAVMLSNWDNAAWYKVYLTTYSYDANGNNTEEIRKNFENNAWENAVYVVNSYDNNGNLLTTKHLLWINSSWNNTTYFQYVRDPNGNCTNSLRQVWDGTSWLNANQSVFTYDPTGNCLEAIHQNWFNNVWVNAAKCVYAHSPGHINGTAYQWEGQWNPGGYALEISRFQNGEQLVLYSGWGNSADYYCNELITNTIDYPQANSKIPSVYPNPAKGAFSLSYYQNEPGMVKIQLYAITGELISTLFQGSIPSGVQSFDFSTHDIPAGIYLVIIRNSGKKFCKKLTILQ